MLLYKNKKAYFDYEILKEFTAGMVLSGSEVKSCRMGRVDFKSAFIVIQESHVILKNAHISKYAYDTSHSYEPKRDRVLLLNAAEMSRIIEKIHSTGVTLIPLEMFTQGRLIKLKIALARGKKKYDKRESIKKRDVERRDLQKYRV